LIVEAVPVDVIWPVEAGYDLMQIHFFGSIWSAGTLETSVANSLFPVL
jgi:hypothetical protein